MIGYHNPKNMNGIKMKVRTDIFSRKILKPLFNAIANSKLGGAYGILDPHGQFDVDLLFAGSKPMVLLYDDIDEQCTSLTESIEKELKELQEDLENISGLNFTERQYIKKQIKYVSKELLDLKQLNGAVENGTILKRTFRLRCEFENDGKISHEEFYYLKSQNEQIKEIEEAYNKAIFYEEIKLPKDIGEYLGYSKLDIKR